MSLKLGSEGDKLTAMVFYFETWQVLAVPFVFNLGVSVLSQEISLVPFLVQTLFPSQKKFPVYQTVSKLRIEVHHCSRAVPSCRQTHGIKEMASRGYVHELKKGHT